MCARVQGVSLFLFTAVIVIIVFIRVIIVAFLGYFGVL